MGEDQEYVHRRLYEVDRFRNWQTPSEPYAYGHRDWQIRGQSPQSSEHAAQGQRPDRRSPVCCCTAGHKLLDFDFSQIELRVGAFYCRDKTMMDTYRNGGDIHASTTSVIFNIPVAEAVDKGKPGLQGAPDDRKERELRDILRLVSERPAEDFEVQGWIG